MVRRSIAARSVFGRAAQAFGERGLVGGDDLLLEGQRLALAVGRAPGPGLPLHLQAGEPVRLELVADEVEAGPAVADAGEGRDARLILGRRDILLPRQALARAGELLVLGPRTGVRPPPRAPA